VKRPLLLFFFLSMPVAAGAAFVAACSSDPEVTGSDVPDATSDTTSAADASDGSVNDGGGGNDAGKCSAVKGPCDIVLQDCPDKSGQKQECVVGKTSTATGSGGTLTTKCVPVQASQTLPAGRACCPNAAGGNPCLPGLTCVGSSCVDGGPITGRCSPACCEGDDQACGLSDPEGIAGSCDLTLYDNDTEVHRVCSYRERCKPFEQEPCKEGSICLIEDKAGTAGCLTSQEKALGAPCGFANDCADGLFCHSDLPDGGDARCHMICLTPNAVHPFDAGVEDGGPLTGGCNPNEQCSITNFANLPAWFSLCTLDGG
jgi:hypothetical protein